MPIDDSPWPFPSKEHAKESTDTARPPAGKPKRDAAEPTQSDKGVGTLEEPNTGEKRSG